MVSGSTGRKEGRTCEDGGIGIGMREREREGEMGMAHLAAAERTNERASDSQRGHRLPEREAETPPSSLRWRRQCIIIMSLSGQSDPPSVVLQSVSGL